MKKYLLIMTIIVIGCLVGCDSEKQKKEVPEKEVVQPTNTPVTKTPVTQNEKDDIETTVDTTWQKTTRIELETPEVVNGFYLNHEGNPIAETDVTFDEDYAYYGTISENAIRAYELSGDDWKETTPQFKNIRKKNEYPHSPKWVYPRKNGEYIVAFPYELPNRADVVRINKNGKIKWKLSLHDILEDSNYIFENATIQDVIYLGDGKALVQCHNSDLLTMNYEGQVTKGLYVAMLDLNEKKILGHFTEGWRLCDAVSENEVFFEYKQKIMKYDVTKGKAVATYSTLALWDMTGDYDEMDNNLIPYRYYPIRWSAYDGELYAVNISGIYKFEEEKKVWKQLVSAKVHGFPIECFSEAEFRVYSGNKALYMGNTETYGDYEGIIYEW